MDKKRKWQLPLIGAVIVLTVYNILPTLFFYLKPLASPISKTQAEECALATAERVDQLEQDSIEWLHSYCQLLGISPQSIATSSSAPDLIHIQCAKTEEAKRLRKYLPRAGLLIPFAPAQMNVLVDSENPKEVQVLRKIGLRLAPLQKTGSLFEFIPKKVNGDISLRYRNFTQHRLDSIARCLTSQTFPNGVLSYATAIEEIASFHDGNPELAGRLAARFAAAIEPQKVLDQFKSARDEIKLAKGKTTDPQETVDYEKMETTLTNAETFLKKRLGLFTASTLPQTVFENRLPLSKASPIFSEIRVDWNKNEAILSLYPDVVASLASPDAESKQRIEQLVMDESAKISRTTHEKISATAQGYSIPLQTMEEMSGILALDLDKLATHQVGSLIEIVRNQWHPEHADLTHLAIVNASEYEHLEPMQKSLCIVVDAKNGSLFVTAKGIGHLLRAYGNANETEEARLFIKDFQAFASLLSSRGFKMQPGDDTTFELPHWAQTLLTATRENFKVLEKTAVLEFSNVEERIIALNKIETAMHEDLLKWDDEYRSSLVSMNSAIRYDVPKPTRNIFWSNLTLSLRKLFRGDEKKILRWGLDLSGGKSVQIELRDQNNQVVTQESDLKQGINELFNRVNKMGVSDVSIRRLGHHIELNFPGSGALSASELVKASSMVFHVINEKFSTGNPALAQSVDRFLQEVWNEAVVTEKQSPEELQQIAYEHLTAKSPTPAANHLLENGLVLADPQTRVASKKLDESTSIVVQVRETKHTHPLLIVFNNHVLEGADLTDIRANYDPAKGNYLSFEVQGSDARSHLLAWTSTFSKERVLGTPREEVSRGNGWRMAVLLNGSVISSPTLESPLQSGAQISGSFTQREIHQLASDLKAGSLTFTPRILLEKNISPELGKTDRMKGIFATAMALILVIASMVAYYRFAGWIASLAVLFNLLILWAVLQNLGASLSLAGIAGIILTVGMAVDANVLVFERMKEEFAFSGRISAAIHAGYEKAFSAILDSNVTTIIAALVLLGFDAGPIKAFAVAMIIGIASSMFTALFMTRVYFSHWLQNPRHTKLSMANWVRASNFDFLKRTKTAFCLAAVIIGLGSSLLIAKRSTLFGMDFTGGYSLQVDLERGKDAVSNLSNAFIAKGASPHDFQIRHHQATNSCQINLGTSMEEVGKPFHSLPLTLEDGSNPRIDWIQGAIEEAGLSLTPTSQKSLASNWTAMSGQMSESMRNNAILGIALACLAIFAYISFRFEYKYAIAALLCLLHDVLITLGAVGILHALKVPVQIDLSTIAAIMTIIGYSLNDTIIVFDRIREDMKGKTGQSMAKVVNLALNATLSRTTITSGTTLLVLVALLLFGGASIFSFALVMTLGVVFGTLSSWFIACPLMLFFHRKEEEGAVVQG